jgi:hypothetical protein
MGSQPTGWGHGGSDGWVIFVSTGNPGGGIKRVEIETHEHVDERVPDFGFTFVYHNRGANRPYWTIRATAKIPFESGFIPRDCFAGSNPKAPVRI